MRHSRYVGAQDDAVPCSFAHPRRCRRGHVAEYSVFCTVRDGVPQENAAVFSKYMQSATGIMQTVSGQHRVGAGGVFPCAVYSV